MRIKPSKIAAYIAAQVILNQYDADWVMYFDEIEDYYPSLKDSGWREDKEYLSEIKEELHRYPQFEDEDDTVILDDESFDCCSWTNYIASEYDAE